MLLPRLRAAVATLAGETFSSLAIPDYRRVFFGNSAFQLSTAMQNLTFGWLLLTIGNSPFWLGMGGLCYGIAMVTMGPVGGALADAWERRRCLLLTQTTSVIVNAVVALLLWLGWLQIWHLLLAALLMGTSFSINMPARQSLMAELVPRRLLPNATALHVSSINMNRIVGPAAAGALLAAIGPLPVLLMNLLANAWTVRLLTRVRYRPSLPPRPFRPRPDDLLDGFRQCWRNRALLSILLVVSVYSFFGLAYIQLLPSLARDTLRVGPDGLGLLTASLGGGALLGSLLLARRGRVGDRQLVIGLASTVLGLLLAILGRVDQLLLASGLMGLIGATSSILTATSIASIQEKVPNQLSGRVFGVYMLTNGLMPLGSMPAGVLATQIGTGGAVSTWGLLCAVLSTTLVLAHRLAPGRRAAAARRHASL